MKKYPSVRADIINTKVAAQVLAEFLGMWEVTQLCEPHAQGTSSQSPGRGRNCSWSPKHLPGYKTLQGSPCFPLLKPGEGRNTWVVFVTQGPSRVLGPWDRLGTCGQKGSVGLYPEKQHTAQGTSEPSKFQRGPLIQVISPWATSNVLNL